MVVTRQLVASRTVLIIAPEASRAPHVRLSASLRWAADENRSRRELDAGNRTALYRVLSGHRCVRDGAIDRGREHHAALHRCRQGCARERRDGGHARGQRGWTIFDNRRCHILGWKQWVRRARYFERRSPHDRRPDRRRDSRWLHRRNGQRSRGREHRRRWRRERREHRRGQRLGRRKHGRHEYGRRWRRWRISVRLRSEPMSELPHQRPPRRIMLQVERYLRLQTDPRAPSLRLALRARSARVPKDLPDGRLSRRSNRCGAPDDVLAYSRNAPP
jgi:hypothetical protein